MAKKQKQEPPDDISKISKRVSGKIVKASEMIDPIKMVIYARPKTGKTRLCATAPGVLLVDVKERGTKSVRRDSNPDVLPVTQWLDIDDVFWYAKEAKHKYHTLAIDGVTGMQTLCMNFVLGEAVSLDATRDPDMPTRQAYGKVSQLMKTQITNLVGLNMNVVFTALTRINRTGGEDDDDLGGDEMIGPAVSPAIANHLEAAVDIIGYLVKRQVMVKKKGGGKKKVRRTRLIVEGSERYLVGDRTGVLPAHVDAPDLTELFKTINEGET